MIIINIISSVFVYYFKMAASDMDVDMPSSSIDTPSKKRFEVKKVNTTIFIYIINLL